MFKEPTNLYRVVAQTLQWVDGVTSMKYDVNRSHLIREKHEGQLHYSFDVVTNAIRLGQLKHPMALVADTIHIAMAGQVGNFPDEYDFGDDNAAHVSIAEMSGVTLKADNGGYSAVSVQTKFTTFGGDEHSFTRQFLYKNNMLYQIR